MSNTYTDKNRGKFNRLYDYKVDDWNNWKELWNKAYGYGFYNSCPKEWNKRYHIRPHRAQTRQALHKVDLDNLGEGVEFPIYGKPHIYYW